MASLLLLALIAATSVATTMADSRVYQNVIVIEEADGSVTTYIEESDRWQDLSEGAAVSVLSASGDGFDGIVRVAGAIDLSYERITGSSVSKAESAKRRLWASDLRQGAELFAKWLNFERGGLSIGNKTYALELWFVGDDSNALQVTNATQRALTLGRADFLLAPYSSSLTELAFKQAKAEGKVMLAAGASDLTLFSDSDNLFGFIPAAKDKSVKIFSAIIESAQNIDAGLASGSCAPTCEAGLYYGSMGDCDDVLLSAAAELFDRVADHQEVKETDSTVLQRATLRNFANKGVTVLEVCRYSVEGMQSLTALMEEVDFNPWAIIARSPVMDSTFQTAVDAGWWHGQYMFGGVPWMPTAKSPHGEFTNMTTTEFADRFSVAYTRAPTYLAAAQWAALSSLCVALEAVESLDSSDVADYLGNMSLTEFYGHLYFDGRRQVTLDHVVVQALETSVEVVYPLASAPDGASIVFPRPNLVQHTCMRTMVNTLKQECSAHGTCSSEGVCVCTGGYYGDICDRLYMEDGGSELLGVTIGAMAASIVILVLCFVLAPFIRWRRKMLGRRLQRELFPAIENAMFEGNKAKEEVAVLRLKKITILWFPKLHRDLENRLQEMRRQVSRESGISVAYILSDEFLQLARDRTGIEDPTFRDLQYSFWAGANPIGKASTCPRDGLPGCSFIDTLEPRHRNRATHFLSWTWGYKLSDVKGALEGWCQAEGADPRTRFLFMCFFVNNQYRILMDSSNTGAADLDGIFEQNLRRINHMVTLLDTWDEPMYLTRVWTIFEQFVAAKMDVPVTMILPLEARRQLWAQIERGKDGILRVKDALSKVSSKDAKAFLPQDEELVKAKILQGRRGFEEVDENIVRTMITWVGDEVELHMRNLVGRISDTASEATGHSGAPGACMLLRSRTNTGKLSEESRFARVGAVRTHSHDTGSCFTSEPSHATHRTAVESPPGFQDHLVDIMEPNGTIAL